MLLEPLTPPPATASSKGGASRGGEKQLKTAAGLQRPQLCPWEVLQGVGVTG